MAHNIFVPSHSRRLAFNLDGVLADNLKSFTHFAHRRDDSLPELGFNDDIPDYDLSKWYAPQHALAQLSNEYLYQQNVYAHVPPLSETGLQLLSVLQDTHELYFLTKRLPSSGDSVELQTRAFLQRHGIRDPRVIRNERKDLVCQAFGIDALFDDNPYELARVSNVVEHPVLRSHSYNKDANYESVDSVAAFVDLVA